MVDAVRIRALVAVGMLGWSTACSDDTVMCPPFYAFGLVVSVEDAAGDSVCDVTVKLQDGGYVEEKTFSETDCVFMGAGERPGTYGVTVSRGDTLLAEDEVSVQADECHVIGKSLTVIVDD
jgi:hypothetical protein